MTIETESEVIDYKDIKMTHWTVRNCKGTSLVDLKHSYSTEAVPNRFNTKEEAYEVYKNKFLDS